MLSRSDANQMNHSLPRIELALALFSMCFGLGVSTESLTLGSAPAMRWMLDATLSGVAPRALWGSAFVLTGLLHGFGLWRRLPYLRAMALIVECIVWLYVGIGAIIYRGNAGGVYVLIALWAGYSRIRLSLK